MGKRDLVRYGIQNEHSHIRVHVCPRARRVYVYPTIRGIEAIESGKHRRVYGTQSGVSFATSEGYLVPPFEIRECVSLSINPNVWRHMNFNESDDTSTKGGKAESMIVQMLKRGMLPIPAIGENIADADMQISGCDIYIKPNALRKQEIVIQVKCDYPGGESEYGGTGNLFLQIAECNPLRKH